MSEHNRKIDNAIALITEGIFQGVATKVLDQVREELRSLRQAEEEPKTDKVTKK